MPTAITEHPIIGKKPGALRAVRFLVSCASVDDGEVSEQPNHGVVLANVPHSGATPDLGDEGGTSNQRSIRICVEEIIGEIFLKPCRVSCVD